MKLTASGIKKDFPRAGKTSNFFTAVQPLDIELSSGRLTVVSGRSGSGKSTLLNMLAGLLTPSAGSVCLDGTDIYALSDGALSRLRNASLGLIPQGNTALNSLSVLENTLLPSVLYSKCAPPYETAASLLGQLGLGSVKDEKPSALSGGELRRMSVARALLTRPGVILADEPTAGLDDENTLLVLSLLRRYADEQLTMNGGMLSR